MVHADMQHLADERSSLARARAHDSVRRESSFAHDVQFHRRCNFDAAVSRSQSGAHLWKRIRFYRVEHLCAFRKQLKECPSLTLGLVEIVDVERRAVSLEQFPAKTMCDHDALPMDDKAAIFSIDNRRARARSTFPPLPVAGNASMWTNQRGTM